MIMKRVLQIAVFVFVNLIVFAIVFLSQVNAQNDEWIPCVPDASIVRLEFWIENGISYMNVSIEFPSSGYNVSSWGTPSIVGNNVSVDAEIWCWTGIDMPVITERVHTYCLGNLSIAEYFFTFNVWGQPVKNVKFIISEFSTVQILMFLLIVSTLAVALYKKKLP